MLNEVELASNYKLLYSDQSGSILYHAGSLYWSSGNINKSTKLFDLTTSVIQKIISRIRPLERMLRMEPRFVVHYEESRYLLSWNCSLYLFDINSKRVKKIFNYRNGMHNPLSITRINSIPNFRDGFVFGDYWANLNNEEVNIYRLEDLKIKRLFSFSAGTVKHIHGISVDQLAGRILISTGDSDDESGIWEAYNDFKSIRPIIKGSQNYRTCSAYLTKHGILYATDSPLTDNAIYIYSEINNKTDILCQLPGPCIYSIRFENIEGEEIFAFATSVEPDSTLPGWQYHFSNKLGAGVKSRKSTIFLGNPERGFKEIASYWKDFWPMSLFQFGNVYFPAQNKVGELFFTPIATKKSDGKTLKIKI